MDGIRGVGFYDVRLHRGKGRPATECPCPTPIHTRCLSGLPTLPKALKGFLDWKSKSVSPGIGLDPRWLSTFHIGAGNHATPQTPSLKEIKPDFQKLYSHFSSSAAHEPGYQLSPDWSWMYSLTSLASSSRKTCFWKSLKMIFVGNGSALKMSLKYLLVEEWQSKDENKPFYGTCKYQFHK